MTCDSPESVIQGTFRSPFLRQIVHKLVLGSQVVHKRHLVAGTVHSLMQMESTRTDIRTEQVDISQGCQSTRNTRSEFKKITLQQRVGGGSKVEASQDLYLRPADLLAASSTMVVGMLCSVFCLAGMICAGAKLTD